MLHVSWNGGNLLFWRIANLLECWKHWIPQDFWILSYGKNRCISVNRGREFMSIFSSSEFTWELVKLFIPYISSFFRVFFHFSPWNLRIKNFIFNDSFKCVFDTTKFGGFYKVYSFVKFHCLWPLFHGQNHHFYLLCLLIFSL